MNVIINPGSNIPKPESSKWSNTYETAKKYADAVLKKINEEIDDRIFIIDNNPIEENGRWIFKFKHPTTEKIVEYAIDGVDNYNEYCKENIFLPKTYWNGSSCSSPEIKDFIDSNHYVRIIKNQS